MAASVAGFEIMLLQVAMGQLFKGCISKHTQEGRVRQQDLALRGGAVQPNGRVFKETPKTFFTLLQFLLDVVAIIDVADHRPANFFPAGIDPQPTWFLPWPTKMCRWHAGYAVRTPGIRPS